jgi:hypothetical protein
MPSGNPSTNYGGKKENFRDEIAQSRLWAEHWAVSTRPLSFSALLVLSHPPLPRAISAPPLCRSSSLPATGLSVGVARLCSPFRRFSGIGRSWSFSASSASRARHLRSPSAPEIDAARRRPTDRIWSSGGAPPRRRSGGVPLFDIKVRFFSPWPRSNRIRSHTQNYIAKITDLEPQERAGDESRCYSCWRRRYYVSISMYIVVACLLAAHTKYTSIYCY